VIDETSTLDDVAFAVCTALGDQGIETILTGGSAAAHYAPEAVQSFDADFVLRFGAESSAGEQAMRAIGFTRTPGHYYAHPATKYTVEFPPGPLSIGSEIVLTWAIEQRGNEYLHVLSPTDCVRDRFIAFYAWGVRAARGCIRRGMRTYVRIHIA
jgi:hypothetical protein